MIYDNEEARVVFNFFEFDIFFIKLSARNCIAGAEHLKFGWNQTVPGAHNMFAKDSKCDVASEYIMRMRKKNETKWQWQRQCQWWRVRKVIHVNHIYQNITNIDIKMENNRRIIKMNESEAGCFSVSKKARAYFVANVWY